VQPRRPSREGPNRNWRSAQQKVRLPSSGHLKEHWPAIRKQLFSGTYTPQPVRRVEIPKPDGGVRKRSIPTPLQYLHHRLLDEPIQDRRERTSYSTNWTRSWSGADTGSHDMRMMATFTSAVGGPANE
jgi:hypothetical protein